jgi:hypothetical protein
MKRFFLLWYLCLFLNFCFAQEKPLPESSYIITTKTVVLKHQDNIPDTLLIPVVSKKYPELRKALSEKNLFDGDDLDSIVTRYKTDGSGITSFSYKVTYLNKGLISLRLYYETMGAYPDNYERWLTLNIHSGKTYSITNEINMAGLKWVFTSYKRNYKKYISAGIREQRKHKEEEAEDAANVYDDLNRSVDRLTFNDMFKTYVFTNKGIIFTTEYVLPHAEKDYELAREWFISYSKLKPYKLPRAIVLNN